MKHFALDAILFRVYGGNSFDQKKPNPVGIDKLRAEAQALPRIRRGYWVTASSTCRPRATPA